MTTYRELLLGCGAKREKQPLLPTADHFRSIDNPEFESHGSDTNFRGLVTLDINTDHRPDIQFNLERIDGQPCNRIPIASNTTIGTPDSHYDEIHAYEVLEHIARQGDYRKFFDQFTEFWRILKPGGFFFATVPAWHSEWAWGDPSHTRVITPGSLVFLSQREYREQVGKTAMSDFRWCYTADFELRYTREVFGSFMFVLQAMK